MKVSCINKEGNIKVEGRLGCSYHEIEEFRVLHGVSRAKSRIEKPILQELKFWPLQGLGRISQVRALKGSRVQENWLIFKHYFIQDLWNSFTFPNIF